MKLTKDPFLRRLVRWGRDREAIHAVLLTGSRANPSAAVDAFSDHDVVLAVEDIYYVQQAGLDVPQDSVSTASEPRDGYEVEQIAELDLESVGIKSIIWATGYRLDFGWVRVPVFDQDGYPIQRRGITGYPGLYFLGLPWLHTLKSGLIYGVGEDAAHIAADMAAKAGDG
jgi:putative flavoprotein involved in K+ transport